MGAKQTAVLVVVVATVGQQSVRPSARSADPARDGRNLVEQRQELGDVLRFPPVSDTASRIPCPHVINSFC